MAECRLIRGGEGFRGKQGLDYFAGISAESTGSKAICMHLLEMPPGASAKPHYHESHETAIFVLEGVAEMRHGSNLEHVMVTGAGTSCTSPPVSRTSRTTRRTASCGR